MQRTKWNSQPPKYLRTEGEISKWWNIEGQIGVITFRMNMHELFSSDMTSKTDVKHSIGYRVSDKPDATSGIVFDPIPGVKNLTHMRVVS